MSGFKAWREDYVTGKCAEYKRNLEARCEGASDRFGVQWSMSSKEGRTRGVRANHRLLEPASLDLTLAALWGYSRTAQRPAPRSATFPPACLPTNPGPLSKSDSTLNPNRFRIRISENLQESAR